MDLIQVLRNAPNHGVYALINHVDKRFLICHSNAIPESVCRFLKQVDQKTFRVPQMIQDMDKINFVHLEKLVDGLEQKLAIKKWVDHFVGLGYQEYASHTQANARIRFTVERIKRKPYVHVYVVTKRNNRKLVGLFETMPEAKEWVWATYPDSNNVTKLVVRRNIGEFYVRD